MEEEKIFRSNKNQLSAGSLADNLLLSSGQSKNRFMYYIGATVREGNKHDEVEKQSESALNLGKNREEISSEREGNEESDPVEDIDQI